MASWFDWALVPGYQQVLDVSERIGMDHAQWGYTLFDAASYGYQCVTSHTIAPVLYAKKAAVYSETAATAALAEGGGEMAMFTKSDVTAYWTFMIAVSTLVAGLLCPILGTIADLYAFRKLFTYVSSVLSIIFLTIFAYSGKDISVHWLLFYVGTAIMFASLAHAFYCSLILTVTQAHEVVKVTCIQAFVGSTGAAILMTALGLHEAPDDMDQNYVLFCFWLAAVWFVILAVPMWLWVQEDPPRKDTTWQEIFTESYFDLTRSLENVELIKFTVSCLLSNDAMSTILAVYLVYGMEIGISVHYLLMGAVFKKWVGGLAALAWLGVSAYMSPKSSLMLSLILGIIAIVLCAWMNNATDFFVMCVFYTVSGSGCYIYQKVLMAELSHKDKASHHFGFMSMASRIAGFMGPFIYTVLSLSISDRAAFMALVFMMLAGLVMLSLVDFDKGREFSARAADESAAAAAAAADGERKEPARLLPKTALLDGAGFSAI